jgi:hypothetical protein
MLMPCRCGVYAVEVEHATYVMGGRPLCNADTCAKVHHHGLLVPRYQPVPLASFEEADRAAG